MRTNDRENLTIKEILDEYDRDTLISLMDSMMNNAYTSNAVSNFREDINMKLTRFISISDLLNNIDEFLEDIG